MSILNQLAAQLESMTEADRQIARHIIAHPEEISALSSVGLAAATGRSQSSVVKFSQRLGYAGYQQLRLAVTRDSLQQWQPPAGVLHGSIKADDTQATIVQKLLGSKLHAIAETGAANTDETVNAVVDVLAGARRILLAGVGASSLVARDFSYKLLKLGLVAMMDSDSHAQMVNAAMLTPADALVAFSQSGASIETLNIAEQARSCGARVIAITGLQVNRLAKLADVTLHTVADEDKVRSSAITARDAQLMLVDLLFMLMLQRQDGAHEHVQRSERAVSVLKS